MTGFIPHSIVFASRNHKNLKPNHPTYKDYISMDIRNL